MGVELGNKIAVHVPTQKEYDWLMEYLDGKGITWWNGIKIKGYDEWKFCKERMCISFNKKGGIGYSRIGFFEEKGYEIITLEEYKRREGLMEFSKKDLKTGMLVEVRRGDKYIIFEDGNWLRDGGCVYEDEYYDDLTCNMTPRGDVMKVYDICDWSLDLDTKHRKLLWERKPKVKEVTMEELERQYGCKVKVVK